MTIPLLATAIRVMWLIIEYLYVRRNKVSPVKDWDKHSAQVWDIASVIEAVGMIIGFLGIGRMRFESNFNGLLGLTLLVAGISLRWTAIYTLGKYFTGTVVIKKDHQLIRAGLYKHLRHPSYTGALMTHLGLGLSFSNWFSLLLSVVPYVVAATYRMRVEERALRDAFGEEYVAYSQSTKRLIPKFY